MKSADLTNKRRVRLRYRILSLAGSFFLIMAAVFCTIGALISAFSFTVDASVLYRHWLAAALVLSSLAAFWRGRGIILSAPLAIALAVWRLPAIVDGAKWVVFFITGEYNKWIEIPVIFSGAQPDIYSTTLFFAFAGICLAFLLAIAVCLRHSTFLTVLFTAPIVFLTFILTFYQPSRWLLLGLLAVYITHVISNALAPDDFHRRSMFIFPALALSLLLLAFAYLFAPDERTNRNEFINSIDDRIRFLSAQAGFTRYNFGAGWPDLPSGEWGFNTESVRVSDAGPRTVSDRGVLEILTTRAGTYYLRGYSMQLFDGRSWYSNADVQGNTDEWLPWTFIADMTMLYSLIYPDRAPIDVNMTITRTGDSSNLMYLPYYSYSYSYGNPYTVGFNSPAESIPAFYSSLPPGIISENLSGYTNQMRGLAVRNQSAYTKIEDSTAEALRRFALDAGIDPHADRAVISDAVAQYISSSARYTLTPYPIPDGEDFALYFLQTSQQGYCIHFATAATLMLRALGVPARFTSGFVATVPYGNVDETVEITDRQAHAWVEVYYGDVGWVPLEVTPPGSGIPVGSSHSSAGSAGWDDDMGDDLYLDWPMGIDPAIASLQNSQSDTDPETQERSGSAKERNAALVALVCIAAFVLFLAMRRLIVLKYRKNRFSQPDTNAAVIFMWRYISRLSRREPPSAEIEEIALKARFSLHRISEAERVLVRGYAIKLSGELYKKFYLPGRLWLKYIRLY